MKRSLDIICAGLGLLITLPILIILCLLIRIETSGSPIFWSKRVGREGRLFLMPKLRTMVETAPQVPTDELTSPNLYITNVGRYLRRYSVDEIPQFYSVLIGDMSLVGPRPLIPQMKDLIHKRKINGIETLRPGITGWAQINGRDYICSERKLILDCEYLDRSSLLFDLKILALTPGYVLHSRFIKH